MNKFKADLEAIKQRAQINIMDGAVTHGTGIAPEAVVDVLNAALATELVCVARYKANSFATTGIHGEVVRQEFLEAAKEEQEHADLLAARIAQLNGTPNFSPENMISSSISKYSTGESLERMLRDNLVAERVAIEFYAEIVRWLGDHDVTSRRLMEKLLADEEHHAEDLRDLYTRFIPPAPVPSQPVRPSPILPQAQTISA